MDLLEDGAADNYKPQLDGALLDEWVDAIPDESERPMYQQRSHLELHRGARYQHGLEAAPPQMVRTITWHPL